MSSHPSVFLVGAGYIGLNVLDQLLDAGYPVTALTRRAEQASELEKRGVKTVSGTLSDTELLTAQTAQHEITINTASCDDLPSVEAILAGVRQRVASSKPVIYLHTSGTGALEDGAAGMYKNEKIYSDTIPGEINSLPGTLMHRHVDIPIIQAQQEFGSKAKIALMLPPLVYGINPAHSRHSIALPTLMRFALKHGFVGYVGEGQNVWSLVHVKDLGRAYLKLLSYIERSGPEVLLENPYFFAENGSEASMLEIAQHLAQALSDAGRLKGPQLKSFTEADYADIFGPFTERGFGCNSRCSSDRLRALGWKANEKDIWQSLEEDEAPELLQ
ncbi:uncharacterized protein N7483_008736 [Penicillium malachiteum]|uniref:uncharacterized protein n=1 Tax=Penicillium malachiteum TaxID=1324776 RepID=UPI00254742A2|nr:uncharacterized protein N7483_008736 [Penicillium malachiteum]KAJ5720802.1 hypothetical protein N7483_008736 [Penicillium malachiteum]